VLLASLRETVNFTTIEFIVEPSGIVLRSKITYERMSDCPAFTLTPRCPGERGNRALPFALGHRPGICGGSPFGVHARMSWFDDQYQASRLRLVVIVFLTAACAGAAKINELETASSPATMAPAARRPLSDRLARSVDVVKVVVLVSMQSDALTR
jgi:hypothetical protein